MSTKKPAPQPPRPTTLLQEPQSTRILTTREKIILLESSKLHESVFPQWQAAPEASAFIDDTENSPFTDKTKFSLSPFQAEIFKGWHRAGATASLLTLEEGYHAGNSKERATAKTLDLVQDATTDCSVVASLCAITSRTERAHQDIFSSVVHPYDFHEGRPSISATGKYVFRLYFNGSYRKVVIDDRLPESNTTRTLHVVAQNSPAVLWPALVEKAYLKARGGYDFPGSNSGTDIWILTAWLPEQLFLARYASCLSSRLVQDHCGQLAHLTTMGYSDDIDRCALWRRVSTSFTYGDVLITLGTGRLTKKEERGMGLVGEHDYAVIDMKELRGQRLFLIKNPWSQSTTWKGHILYGDEIQAFENLYLNESRERSYVENQDMAPGTFWMGLEDVFQNFESIYLNWNPGLFSHREDIHFQWYLAKQRASGSSFRSNPQFSLGSSNGGLVWLLLGRHFTSRSGSSSDTSEKSDATKSADQGFISLCIFDKDGQRVITNEGATAISPYVDSPNTLLKLEVPAGRIRTIVISEQALAQATHTFTLSALSLKPVSLAPARDKYLHNAEHHDEWAPTTAGGNAGSPLYQVNPQYSMTLYAASDVSLLLESSAEALPVHVKLVWASGKRVHSVNTQDIVGDSGEHTKGSAYVEICGVPQGSYTIVCSTFERGQTGAFVLHVATISGCHVSRLPMADSGRFMSAVRSAVFPEAIDRLMAPLVSGRMNRLSMSAWSRGDRSLSSRQTNPALKLSLELGRGPSKQILVVSGDDEFIDTSHARAHTRDIDLQPKMCYSGQLWIVLERLAGAGIHHDEEVDMEILSEQPVEVGSWVTEGPE